MQLSWPSEPVLAFTVCFPLSRVHQKRLCSLFDGTAPPTPEQWLVSWDHAAHQCSGRLQVFFGTLRLKMACLRVQKGGATI